MGELHGRIAAVQREHRVLAGFGPPACKCGWRGEWADYYAHAADAVLDALRSQLEAFGRLCVEGGDMTPAAERMLLRVLD